MIFGCQIPVITSSPLLRGNIPSSSAYGVLQLTPYVLSLLHIYMLYWIIWGPFDFPVSDSKRDTSLNVWNRHTGSYMVDAFQDVPPRKCLNDILKWQVTKYNFPTDQNFHKFTFTKMRVVSREHLQRCGMLAGNAYLSGHMVPSLLGTCTSSNCWDRFSRSCRCFPDFSLQISFDILSRLCFYSW